MRETWGEPPSVEIELDGLTRLLQPALPGERAALARPVGGGLANANLQVLLAGQARPVLVRFFVRDPKAMLKERADHRAAPWHRTGSAGAIRRRVER